VAKKRSKSVEKYAALSDKVQCSYWV